jgi:hypothetical protein
MFKKLTVLGCALLVAGVASATPVTIEKGASPGAVAVYGSLFGEVDFVYSAVDRRAEVVNGVTGTFYDTYCIEPFVDDTPAGFLPGTRAQFDAGQLLGRVRTDKTNAIVPTPTYITNPANVEALERLWNGAFALTGTDLERNAAFQWLVWELALDTAGSFNLTTGNVQILNLVDTGDAAQDAITDRVFAIADGWLNLYALNPLQDRTALVFYDGLGGTANPSGEAQGFIGPARDTPLPVPAVPALIGLGLLATGLMQRKSKR